MSDYLRSNALPREVGEYYDEEEADDLDGFVASDDEFIDGDDMGEDYSEEIRKIFGYDRRK